VEPSAGWWWWWWCFEYKIVSDDYQFVLFTRTLVHTRAHSQVNRVKMAYVLYK
jgi:hypothetical protein